jgi:hypothetical protein
MPHGPGGALDNLAESHAAVSSAGNPVSESDLYR